MAGGKAGVRHTDTTQCPSSTLKSLVLLQMCECRSLPSTLFAENERINSTAHVYLPWWQVLLITLDGNLSTVGFLLFLNSLSSLQLMTQLGFPLYTFSEKNMPVGDCESQAYS